MSSSYKPVMLAAMLTRADEHGRARLDDVVQEFRYFYLDRITKSLRVERPGMRMDRVADLSPEDVRSLMLAMPFRKFEQRKYVAYDREDLAFVRFQRGIVAPAYRRGSDHDSKAVRTSHQ